ncbi:hypothetical protein B9Z19DRAFT_1081393 [Tuber borchii]|uniref:Uncharacterized protein n=1 Tax=Tuber borchii TaxID=42251 RepID=A0A2T6ZVP2_TUBBO|nr:hypothetical protein B9Z19DRAFT_1081393 [Tuber borchii]
MTDLVVTKIINFLLPRQTSICLRVTCNLQYYCCNDQTCAFQSNSWKCLWPTRTVTATSTYQSTTTSTITTTLSFTSTTWDTITTRVSASITGVWTKTTTVTSTATETSFTTTSTTLTKRGMPTEAPVRCVSRPEEEEKRGLAKRADPTVYVTTTIVVTMTPPSTYFFTTTWLYTYWITGLTTTTLTTFVDVDRTSTVTSTYLTSTTTTSTVTETITKTPTPVPIDVKVGAGVGGGVGGLLLIALGALIWKKCTKPTAEEEWAGNQPVEDRTAPPGGAGPGMVPVGPGGVPLAAGATDKVPYKAGYYDQGGNVVVTETSPSPAPPPVAHFQPAQYPQGYPELGPNDTGINTIPRRPVPGSPAPPSYQG